MPKHDDAFYLEGIRGHILAIRAYLPSSKEAYLADEKTQDAVLMRLLALGEDVARLSEPFQEKHSHIEWFKIVGLRNRIAHGYFEVDPEIVWETVAAHSFDDLLRTTEPRL